MYIFGSDDNGGRDGFYQNIAYYFGESGTGGSVETSGGSVGGNNVGATESPIKIDYEGAYHNQAIEISK